MRKSTTLICLQIISRDFKNICKLFFFNVDWISTIDSKFQSSLSKWRFISAYTYIRWKLQSRLVQAQQVAIGPAEFASQVHQCRIKLPESYGSQSQRGAYATQFSSAWPTCVRIAHISSLETLKWDILDGKANVACLRLQLPT